MNDNVIDLRDKEEEKVIEGYAIAAKEMQVQNEIWQQTKSLDKALNLYKKLKFQNKIEKENFNNEQIEE